MATTQREIDKYVVQHLNEDNTYGQSAVINCYKSRSFKGSLYFYKEGTSIPASSKTSSGYLYLRFRHSELENLLDTLRQEKPLYIWFRDEDNWGGLKTSREPVGEEEAKPVGGEEA